MLCSEVREKTAALFLFQKTNRHLKDVYCEPDLCLTRLVPTRARPSAHPKCLLNHEPLTAARNSTPHDRLLEQSAIFCTQSGVSPGQEFVAIEFFDLAAVA